MDIESILKSLGLDLTNPEAKRGAIEAIDAILGSRQPNDGFSGSTGGGGNEQDLEIDPDLLQPSIKNNSQTPDDEDIEINDEDDILKDVKYNDSDDSTKSPMTNKEEKGDSEEESSSSDESEDTDGEQADSSSDDTESTSEQDKNTGASEESDAEDVNAKESDGENSATNSDDSIDGGTEDEKAEAEASDEESDASEDSLENNSEEDADGNYSEEDEIDTDSESDTEDPDGAFEDESTDEADSAEPSDDELDADETEEDDELDIDEDELLDDTLKDTYEDQEDKTKHEARKIKRERTLLAAKNALADAKAKNKSQALIRELEKAIEALESLQEAVAKNLKDLSDEEFNLMVNRVFDAIDALGDSGLTYTSDEERQLKAQEIKADIENKQTQAELSAEDVAQIRAETQAVKARDKEKAKYQVREKSSFKGFQDFLNSLYRAIALQVTTSEEQDSTWSAINRRYSGTGVIQQGKRLNELPNKKIPIIDFYFDCSGSWGPADIAIGKKAVEQLAEMEAKGQIQINLYYFGESVSAVYEDVAGGGTSGWNEIVKNVIATQATNVIVMTDSDMESWWEPMNKPPLRYTVPGYVWYLWRNGENAPRLARDLKGRGGTQQFSFNRGDL
jgi:hypothetical protein